MPIPAALLLDLAMNERVQGLAARALDTVYSRNFKSNDEKLETKLIDAQPLSPGDRLIFDRLSAIEERLVRMPTDNEMASAFAAMQAQIKATQQRMMLALLFLGLVNVGLVVILILR